MTNREIEKIVIVGGGTAGWMSAAAIAKALGTSRYSITLIESEEIGTVGVGEATIPPLVLFNNGLGISERDFVAATNATFKLGIEFVDWRRRGHTYFHPFGRFGADIDGIGFQHFWTYWRDKFGLVDYGVFNAETEAARAKRFALHASIAQNGMPKLNYAYQFDALRYAALLRTLAEMRGVTRIEGRVDIVEQDGDRGSINAIVMEGGRRIEGDFFVDCTGFQGLLIEKTLLVGFEDWSRWLPVDRAITAPTQSMADLPPFTRATAQEAGWQWRIPLQHRTGNGYVYSSRFTDDGEAEATFVKSLHGEPLAEPRRLNFKTGMRRHAWVENCVAIGLSSGFLEPLESTSIHLIQTGIGKLLELFPRLSGESALSAKYNAAMAFHFTTIRDFLIAHYHQTERDDTPFWSHVRSYDVPDTLARRLDLYDRRGEVLIDDRELFKEDNWFFVLAGQGRLPKGTHPIASAASEEEVRARMIAFRSGVRRRVAMLPSHNAFIHTTWPMPD